MNIERITLAVTHMKEMVAFYDNLFESGMAQVGHGPFQSGTFAGLNVMFCPNEIARVDATQNRHQFRLTVTNVDEILDRLPAARGEVINRGEDRGRRVLGVRDPDGNTYEFVER